VASLLVWRRCAGHLTERDLLDVTGVVLEVRPRAGEGDAVIGAVVQQRAIDEFGSVVEHEQIGLTLAR
jgi:hypothetical protein